MSNPVYDLENLNLLDDYDLGLPDDFEPIGETEIFQSFDGSNPIESQIVSADIPNVPDTTSTLLTQDYDPNDIYTYNYQDPLSPQYRFLTPKELGTPEGIEAIYAPEERDPFRQDFSEASFRTPSEYAGNLLSPDDMVVVQNAQNFLSNVELRAKQGNHSTTQDYLRFLEATDPEAFGVLLQEFNTASGIWDEYGDLYQFQVSYDRFNRTSEEYDPDPSDVTDAAASLLQAFLIPPWY